MESDRENSDKLTSTFLSSHSPSRKPRLATVVVVSTLTAIVLFAVLAPIIPTTIVGAGASVARIHFVASISFVLTGSFGVTYWQGHFFWGRPLNPNYV